MELKRKETYRVIGLLSGTSIDGIDAALVDVRGAGPGLSAALVGFRTFRISPADRERLRNAAGKGRKDVAERARIDVRMGELFARAAAKLAVEHGGLESVDLIGSHGQTLLHLPARREGATVQIGNGAGIAARTGVPVVADFRAADIAAGGEGAPLLPVTDYLLFRSDKTDRVILNIGGIANITFLPAGAPWSKTLAYDTGPGNTLIDRIVWSVTEGRTPFDRGGRLAARGRVAPGLLEPLLRHPFLRRKPPRSTGTSTFGDRLAADLRRRAERRGISVADLLATATAFTAKSAGREIRRRSGEECEVYVCGGGVHNRTLLKMIREEVAPRPVLPLERLGIGPDAREAVGFALLAREFLAGNRYDLRSITGAKSAAPLGVFFPGPRPYTIDPGKEIQT